jgi:predicted amidohydrolase YtcJ
VKNFPTNEALNKLFPDIKVFLKRVDGHAAIDNNKALELAQLNINTKIDGGELIESGNKLTGVLIDNAVELVLKKLPKHDRSSITKLLLMAQQVCIDLGLTSVCDAVLDTEVIEIIDSLQKKQLFIRVYAMISTNDKQADEWLSWTYKNYVLEVSSFKMYADGARGSRGAYLLNPYNDHNHNHGIIVTPLAKMEAYVKRNCHSTYQLNTHCIGDSANRYLINLYGKYLGETATAGGE